MEISVNHTGIVIVLVTALIVILLILINKVKKYKNEQISNYNQLCNSCIRSIDMFAKESKRLSDITDCLVSEIKDFKKSKVYKDYNNGVRK